MALLTEAERTSRLVSDEHEKWSVVHKFGRFDSVPTTFTPICASGFYRTPTAATALEVVSGDVNDTAAGTGAQEVTITGLDSTWAQVSQTVELNGTTAVALSTNLIRVYRWFVSRVGTYATQAAGSHVGALTIQESGAGDVWSVIPVTDFPRGQSQIGAYTIPDGKRGFVLSMAIDVDSTKTGNLIFFKRENADDVTTPFTGAMRAQVEFDGVAGSTSLMPMTPLGPFPARTDIGFLGRTTQTTAAMSVDFEILLEDA